MRPWLITITLRTGSPRYAVRLPRDNTNQGGVCLTAADGNPKVRARCSSARYRDTSSIVVSREHVGLLRVQGLVVSRRRGHVTYTRAHRAWNNCRISIEQSVSSCAVYNWWGRYLAWDSSWARTWREAMLLKEGGVRKSHAPEAIRAIVLSFLEL